MIRVHPEGQISRGLEVAVILHRLQQKIEKSDGEISESAASGSLNSVFRNASLALKGLVQY